MKNVVLASILCCISLISFSQTAEQCGEQAMHQKMLRIDPNYAAKKAQLEQEIQQYIQNRNQSPSLSTGFTIDTTVTYTIPIVFHVIHTGGSVGTTYNPSTANITALLAKLNDDWSNGAGNGVDFKIQFALAQRTESCASTTGIERINGSSLTNYVSYGVNANNTNGVSDSAVKALSDWSRDSYVNVWIVNKIDGSDGTSGSFTAGFAYIPPTYSYLDGIVILATQTNGSSSTLSHEMGHFFSLYHTFQGDGTGSTCPSDADCGTNGDCCADTPPMKRSSSTCPTYTTTCSGAPFNNVYYNFMDYSSCRDRFTSDQLDRVRAALATYRPGLAVNSGTTTAPTTPATSACTPGITNSGNTYGMGPVDVAFDVYDNTTYNYSNDGTAYKDYSCLQEYPVNAGQTYSISVKTETNSQLVRVYVDYNNNGTLDDSGELVFSSNASGAPHTHTGTFTIPSSGVTTNTPIRMRVWADYINSTSYGPCGNLLYGQAEDYSLVVTPAPASITTSSISTTTYCAGASISVPFTSTGTFNSGNIYTAQLSNSSGSFSSPVSLGTLTSTGSSGTISGTIRNTTTGTGYKVRVIGSNPSTTGSTSTSTLTINATVTPSVSISTSTTTICSGTSVTLSATPTNGGSSPAYQWYKNGSTISGATSSSYTTTTIANHDSIWVVMTSNATCPSPSTATSNKKTFTVNSNVTPSVSISANSTTVCAGGSVTFTASPTNGGGLPLYDWYKNGSNILSTLSATYSTTGLSNNDSVWVVMTSSATCPSPSTATSNHVTITVNATVTPSASISTSTTTICSGTSVTMAATPTNGGSSPTYQWYKDGSSISGATSSNYTTTSIANHDSLWVVMTSNANCASPTTATSNKLTFTVTGVVSPAVNASVTTSQTICQGGSVSFEASPVNGGSNPTYQWYKNSSAISGATNSTYTGTGFSNNDTVWVVMTSSATCASPTTAASTHFVITVNPTVTPSVSASASNTTICATNSVTFTATPTNGGGSPSYHWYKNGSSISGATSSTYTTTALSNNDSIWVVMTSNATCASPTTATSNHVIMTVNSLVIPAVSASASSTTICAGSSVTFTATPSDGGSSPTYQWYKNSASISGATSSTYTTSSLANGDTVWVVMTSNATCPVSSTATSNRITIMVNSSLVPTVSIVSNQGDSICQNQIVVFISTVTNGGSAPTYQWYKNGTAINGATSSTYPNTSLANHDSIWVVVTSSETCASPTMATSNHIVMIVNQPLTTEVAITASNTTVCAGSNVTFTATPTNGGSSPSYQWYKNGSTISGATSSTYSSTGLADNDSIWVFMLSNAVCPYPSGTSSNHIVMTVNPLVTPSATISTASTTICSGSSVTMTATPTNSGSSPTYQWYQDGSSISGATSSSYTTSSILNNDSLWVVMTSNANCANPTTATSNKLTYTVTGVVSPSFFVTADNSTIICPSDTVKFRVVGSANGGSTPSFHWYINGNQVPGVDTTVYNGTGFANHDTVWAVMTSSAACASPNTDTSFRYVITVNPTVTPSVSVSASSSTICVGNNVTFTATPTNGGSSPSYQWYMNGSVIVGATSSTYSTVSLANNDSIWVVMTSNARCASTTTATSNHVVITVNPVVIPVVDATASNTTACSGVGVTFTATPTSGGGASPTYQWYKGGSPVIGATNSTFSASSLAGNFTVYVKMTSSDACALPTTDTSNHILITVVQYVTPTVSISANDTVTCVGNNVAFGANITNGGSSPTYVWYKNGSVISGANLNSYQTTALANHDSVWVEMTSNATCASPATVTSSHLVMTVNPTVTPVLTISTNTATICAGDTVTFTGATVNGGNSPSYGWYKNGVYIAGTNQSTYTTSNLSNHDTITATIESNAACPSPAVVTSNPIVMTVNASVVPTVHINNVNTHICAGDNVYFTTARNHAGSSPTYQWYKNNAPISGANLSSYAATGVVDQDSFYVEMTSSATCPRPVTVASSQVVISVTPTTPASVSISISQNNVCEGSSVTFTATPTYGGTTPTYQWYLNENNINGATSSTFTTSSLANNDSVYVEMASSATCPSPWLANSNSITMLFLPTLRDTVTTSICPGQSYDGYTATGTYIDTTTGSNGCDSIRTLHLTVLPIVHDTVTTNICSGQSYAGHDTTGTYTDTYTGSNGCDSVRVLNLIVQSLIQTNINHSVCQGQTYAGYGTAGTYVDTFTAQGGCDSIRTLNLTILSIPRDTISQTVCQGQSYAGYGTAGTYVDTFAAANGCDSIRTLHLTVSPPLTSSTNESICQGDSYNFNGQVLTVAGTYTDTLQTSGGCDSIATVVLSIIAPSAYSFSDSICQGSSYAFGGQTLTTGGTYSDTITAGSGSGCDSIITLTLVIKQPTSSTVNAAICTGNTYSFNGQTLDTAGTYQATLTGSNGCDSVVTLNLQVQSVLTTSLSESICQGTSYTFGSQTLTTAGTYMDTLPSTGGCDSVVTLTLAIIPGYNDTTTQTICPGDSFAGHSTAGIYIDSLTSISGCDSISTLILTVSGQVPTITQMGDTLLDAGSGFISYQWFVNDTLIQGATNQTFAIVGNGIYTVQVINLDGCVITSAADTVIGVGIDQIDVAQGISIYPNPANDVLNVVLKNHQTYLLDIVNVEGKVLITDKVTNSTAIDLKQLAAGVYLLRLHNEQGYTITKRFVKER